MNYGSIGTIWAEIGLNTKKLDEGLMKAQLKLAQTDKAVTTFGQKLSLQSTKLITAGGIMAGAVTAVGVATVKMAADFEKSMRNVNSIARLSEKEFAKMSGEVLDLSKTLPQSAKTLADGLYDISSSGFAGADGLKVLEAAAKAASAGITTTETSAKGITAVLNAYGLEAEDAAAVSDTMFKTVDKGVISFEELSSTIGDVVGTANLADINFNELSGALAYLTTKGIGAAEATTSLNRLILSIIKPSEELAVVLQEAGFQSGEAAIKQLGLVGVLELMEKASGGSLTKLQELSPEMRALKASGALLGNGIEDLNAYMNEFKDTTGATQKALDEQSKSLDFQLQILRNNISAIGITLGTELLPNVTNTTKEFSQWIDKNDKLAVSLIKIIGGGAITAGGFLGLAGAIGKVSIAMAALNGTALGVAGFGAIGGGLVGVTALVWEATKAWEAYKLVTGDIEDTLVDLSSSIDYLSIMTNSQRRFTDDWTQAQKDAIGTGFDYNKQTREILDTLNQLAALDPNIEKKIMDVAIAIKEGKINGAEARGALEQLLGTYQAIGDGMQGYDKHMGEAASNTQETTDAIEDFGEAAGNTAIDVGDLDEAVSGLNDAIDEGSISPAEYIKQLELLGTTVNDVDGGFERIVHSAFRLFNATAASDESIKSIEELLKAYEEAASKTGSTFNKNDEALQAYLSTNVDYLKNQQQQAELGKKLSEINKEKDLIGYLETQESLNNTIAEGNEIVKEAARVTGTYISTGEQTAAQLEETRKAEEELAKAIEQGLIDWQWEYQTLANSLTPLTEEQVNRQKELQEEYITTGLKATELKEISVDDFEAMASGFGLSAEDIIEFADNMGLEIDDATRERLIQIDAEDAAAQMKIDELAGTLFTLVDGEYVAVINADNKPAEEIIAETSDQLYKIVNGEYVPIIEADNSDALEGIEETEDKLNDLDGKTATVNIKYKVTGSVGSSFSENAIKTQAMGGIVGYSGGGIVGIPQAASGMVVPQTGNEHLIIAHDYETILNTSQQKNIAEWIMGRANSRPEGGVNVPIEIRIPVELDGRIIAETSASFIYDGTQTKIRLGG